MTQRLQLVLKHLQHIVCQADMVLHPIPRHDFDLAGNILHLEQAANSSGSDSAHYPHGFRLHLTYLPEGHADNQHTRMESAIRAALADLICVREGNSDIETAEKTLQFLYQAAVDNGYDVADYAEDCTPEQKDSDES